MSFSLSFSAIIGLVMGLKSYCFKGDKFETFIFEMFIHSLGLFEKTWASWPPNVFKDQHMAASFWQVSSGFRQSGPALGAARAVLPYGSDNIIFFSGTGLNSGHLM